MKSTINYVVFSDVHLGHRRTPTSFIIKNLRTVLEPLFSKGLDIIFIAGDLYDRLLDNSMEDIAEIHIWMHWLLKNCAQYKIKLRILEGTPSHDWKQSTSGDLVKRIAELDLDYQYISTLHVEHMEDLGIRILYVPDEWHESTQETYRQATELIQQSGVNQVDIAIMHGQFTYQIPQAPMTVPRHQEQQYLDIVKHYIHIGHVHTHSVFERIIAQGSFDRLAHGEEEPKGLIWATLHATGDRSYHFIENKKAMVYKTIMLKGYTLEEVIAYLDQRILKYPTDTHIRLKGAKNHLGFQHFDDLKKRYIMYHLVKKGTEEKDERALVLDITSDEEEYKSFSITEENIGILLKQNIQLRQDKVMFTDRHWEYYDHYLKEALENRSRS